MGVSRVRKWRRRLDRRIFSESYLGIYMWGKMPSHPHNSRLADLHVLDPGGRDRQQPHHLLALQHIWWELAGKVGGGGVGGTQKVAVTPREEQGLSLVYKPVEGLQQLVLRVATKRVKLFMEERPE